MTTSLDAKYANTPVSELESLYESMLSEFEKFRVAAFSRKPPSWFSLFFNKRKIVEAISRQNRESEMLFHNIQELSAYITYRKKLAASGDKVERITAVMHLIENHNFILNHGGVKHKIFDFRLSKGAVTVYDIVRNVYKKANKRRIAAGRYGKIYITQEEYENACEEIHAELEKKLETTAGIYGLFARDETTVDLYRNILRLLDLRISREQGVQQQAVHLASLPS